MIESLIQNESGGNWQARNNEIGAGGQAGHFGRMQFGRARLQDAMRAGVLPPGTTPEQFMASPQLQLAVEAWHFADIDRQAQRLGLTRFIGQEIGGVLVTPDAIRSMAHLGGIGGAARFLETGGRYNPSDSFGTSLRDYGQRHGGSRRNQSGGQAYGGQDSMPGNAMAQMGQAPVNMLAIMPPAEPELPQIRSTALNAADFAQPVQPNALAQYGFLPGQSPYLIG